MQGFNICSFVVSVFLFLFFLSKERKKPAITYIHCLTKPKLQQSSSTTKLKYFLNFGSVCDMGLYYLVWSPGNRQWLQTTMK